MALKQFHGYLILDWLLSFFYALHIIIFMGFFNSKPESKAPAFTYQNMIKHITQEKVQQNYEIAELLGRGSYAEVRRAKHRRTGQSRAIKTIDRVKHAKIQPLLLKQFEILKSLDHPNILKIYEIYEETRFYHIVTELCEGNELFEHLRECKYFTEKEAFGIFWQLSSAVQYLHSRGVMHRDLKPENVMYDTNKNTLKLIDFGTSLRYDSEEEIQTRRVGTSYYIAPEVIKRSYNNKCDVWSLGIVLYVLLCGEPPFKGHNDEEILANILEGDYNLARGVWDTVSTEAKMLVTDMLTKDPINRSNINQVLNSDWIRKNLAWKRGNEEAGNKNMKEALTNLKKFKETQSNKIEGAMLVFIVNFVKNPQDEAELQRSFKDLDLNGDGMLSVDELAKGLQKYLKISEKEAQAVAINIFQRVDTNKSGYIDYSEFLVAAKGIEMAATSQNLQLAFECLDQDKNGLVSAEQLRRKLGDNISVQQYEKLVKQSIPNCTGQISKKDFVSMMMKLVKCQ